MKISENEIHSQTIDFKISEVLLSLDNLGVGHQTKQQIVKHKG